MPLQLCDFQNLTTVYAIEISRQSVADPDPLDPLFLGLSDPLVRSTDPDPSIIKQK
jgi:hypothetical protein